MYSSTGRGLTRAGAMVSEFGGLPAGHAITAMDRKGVDWKVRCFDPRRRSRGANVSAAPAALGPLMASV